MDNPIAAVTALVSLAHSLFDFASKIKKDDISKDEFLLKVSEWNKQLLETQLVITDLINKNMALEQENRRLKEHESDPLIWRNAKYWKDGDDVPFCPVCYESPERYRHHMTPYSPTAGAITYTCGHCKRYS